MLGWEYDIIYVVEVDIVYRTMRSSNIKVLAHANRTIIHHLLVVTVAQGHRQSLLHKLDVSAEYNLGSLLNHHTLVILIIGRDLSIKDKRAKICTYSNNHLLRILNLVSHLQVVKHPAHVSNDRVVVVLRLLSFGNPNQLHLVNSLAREVLFHSSPPIGRLQ